MKRASRAGIIFILLIILSCATLTRQTFDVERDEFLNKFPMLNTEILGELKYDDLDSDLRTLAITNYFAIAAKVDLTEDYQKVLHFVQTNTPERKLVVQPKTFVICLRSESYQFVLCDDAATPYLDKVKVGEPVPAFDKFYAGVLSDVGLIKQ